jgi:Cu/Ag efflux protein CusF
MTKSIPILLMFAALCASSAWSQAAPAQQVAQAKPMAAVPFTEGEVRKIDKDNKKITIKHGEIKNLNMPPMTMVFVAVDPSMLDKVHAGDKVRFKASEEGGKLMVTEIQAAK